jgi:hypothetical protein
MSDPTQAAQAAMEAYLMAGDDEESGRLAAAFLAAALYLDHDCQQLISISNKLEAM